MNAPGDLQSRHSHIPDAIHVEEKRHRIGRNNQCNQRATQAPGLACDINAQDGTSQNESHRNTVDHAECEVVDCREPQVWKRGGDILRGSVELGDAWMRARKRVDRQNTDGDNDHRGEDTDDFHDAIKIKEGRDDNQNCADRTSRPCRDSKLLFQVRSRA